MSSNFFEKNLAKKKCRYNSCCDMDLQEGLMPKQGDFVQHAKINGIKYLK